MKKTAILLVVAALVALSLAACGNNAQEEKTGNEPVKNEVKIIQTEKGTQNVESGTEKPSTDQTKPEDQTATPAAEETKPVETQTPETPAADTTSQGQEKISVFKGQYVSCRLPEKWASQEDLGQGVAAALLDPSTKAGVVIQFVKDNKDTLDGIVEGINAQIKGNVDDYSIGGNNFKRITAIMQGKTVTYLILVKGTMAYYVSTDILDQEDARLVLSTLEFK